MEEDNESNRSPSVVTIIIKNPAALSSVDFKMEMPAEDNVLAIKRRLQRDYAGIPTISSQKLIVAGQLVKDEATIREVFKQKDLSEPQVMHLVVSDKGSIASTSSSPQRSLDSTLTAGTTPASVQTSDSSNTVESLQSLLSNQNPSADISSPPISVVQPTAAESSQIHASISQPPSSSDAGPTPSAVVQDGSPAGLSGAPLMPPDAYNTGFVQMMYGGGVLNPFTFNPSLAVLHPAYAAYSAALLNPAAFGGMPPQFSSFMQPMYTGFQPAVLPGQYIAPGEQNGHQPGGVFPVGPIPGLGGMPLLPGMYGGGYGIPPFNMPMGPQMQFTRGAPHGTPLAGVQTGFNPTAVPGQHQGQPRVQVQQVPQPVVQGAQGLNGPAGQLNFVPRAMNENGAPGRRIRIAVRLDLMLIMKLTIVVFIFNQEGSTPRLFFLSILAVLIYLYQSGALTPALRWILEWTHRAIGIQPTPPADPVVNPQAEQVVAPPAPQQPFGDGGAEPVREEAVQPEGVQAGTQDGRAPDGQTPPAGVVGVQVGANLGILHEIKMFLLGFVTSLLPGFQGPDQPLVAPVARQDELRPHVD